jgi:outer membrane biosynthesis protein TonB
VAPPVIAPPVVTPPPVVAPPVQTAQQQADAARKAKLADDAEKKRLALKAEADKAAKEKADKLAAEKAVRDKEKADKLAADKAAKEKLAADKAAARAAKVAPPPPPPPAAVTEAPAPAPSGPSRAFSAAPVEGGAPPYPTVYQDDQRLGKVTVSCLIGTSGSPSGCRVIATQGGTQFGNSVLRWLGSGSVRFAPILHNGQAVAETHQWTVTFQP